ncbi:hypothetical protein GCM10010872_39330 [Dyella flava]|nr:hypothetical protein GCM10010872_39330 [Dyella flava]
MGVGPPPDARLPGSADGEGIPLALQVTYDPFSGSTLPPACEVFTTDLTPCMNRADGSRRFHKRNGSIIS